MIDEKLFQLVTNIRRDIHENPETGFDVQRTAAIVADELNKLGIRVKTKVGVSGVVGDIEVPGASKKIALRADMDALPMQEEGRPSYRSKIDGKAHMCGHDSHTAMLIGAANILMNAKQKLKTSVRFIFQPSEEMVPGGALGMIDEGCLEGVSAIYGLHVWPWLDTGIVGVCPGPMMAQADYFFIEIQGKGGHAAAPHEVVDPLYIGSQLVSMMQSLVSRRCNPQDPAVVSITQFQAGSAYNVIPESAFISGTVRTYSPQLLKIIKTELQRLVDQGVSSFGAKATLNYRNGYPPLVNTEAESENVKHVAQSFLEKEKILYPAERVMFGEDFAYYLHHVPGCFIQLGCRNYSKECIYPLHHPKFNLDEDCMKIGIRLLAEIIIRNK